MSEGLLLDSVRRSGDPADRILAAGARIHDLLFITRDGKILEYGAAGHLRVMEC